MVDKNEKAKCIQEEGVDNEVWIRECERLTETLKNKRLILLVDTVLLFLMIAVIFLLFFGAGKLIRLIGMGVVVLGLLISFIIKCTKSNEKSPIIRTLIMLVIWSFNIMITCCK